MRDYYTKSPINFSYIIGQDFADGIAYAKQHFYRLYNTNKYFEFTEQPQQLRQVKVLSSAELIKTMESRAKIYITPKAGQSAEWLDILQLIRLKNAVICLI